MRRSGPDARESTCETRWRCDFVTNHNGSVALVQKPEAANLHRQAHAACRTESTLLNQFMTRFQLALFWSKRDCGGLNRAVSLEPGRATLGSAWPTTSGSP